MGRQSREGGNVSEIGKNNLLNSHTKSYFKKNCSKDVRLPVQLQRAMAAEAEAAREARAKVIAAEGEQKASRYYTNIP